MCNLNELCPVELKLQRSQLYLSPSCCTFIWLLRVFWSAVVYGHCSHFIRLSVCLLFMWFWREYWLLNLTSHWLQSKRTPSCFIRLCLLTSAKEQNSPELARRQASVWTVATPWGRGWDSRGTRNCEPEDEEAWDFPLQLDTLCWGWGWWYWRCLLNFKKVRSWSCICSLPSTNLKFNWSSSSVFMSACVPTYFWSSRTGSKDNRWNKYFNSLYHWLVLRFT